MIIPVFVQSICLRTTISTVFNLQNTVLLSNKDVNIIFFKVTLTIIATIQQKPCVKSTTLNSKYNTTTLFLSFRASRVRYKEFHVMRRNRIYKYALLIIDVMVL